MRPPRIQRNNLQYPLDSILGTPANVRLLRVLVHEVQTAVSVTDAARLSGLTVAGARRALEFLEKFGIITRVGTGRALKFGTVAGNPFVPLIRQLFVTERHGYDDLIDALRQAVALPELHSAWLKEAPFTADAVLVIEVIAPVKTIGWVGVELRSRLLPIERRYNRIIEFDLFTRADQREIPESAIVLWTSGGTGNNAGRPEDTLSVDAEARSIRVARVIADLVRKDPSLVSRTLQYLDRLLREGQGTANTDLGEWRQLLESYSTERLRDLLVSGSSRAKRLRRSLPFYGVLTQEERDHIFKQLESSR